METLPAVFLAILDEVLEVVLRPAQEASLEQFFFASPFLLGRWLQGRVIYLQGLVVLLLLQQLCKLIFAVIEMVLGNDHLLYQSLLISFAARLSSFFIAASSHLILEFLVNGVFDDLLVFLVVINEIVEDIDGRHSKIQGSRLLLDLLFDLFVELVGAGFSSCQQLLDFLL